MTLTEANTFSNKKSRLGLQAAFSLFEPEFQFFSLRFNSLSFIYATATCPSQTCRFFEHRGLSYSAC
jgi:hypothetical protein